MFEAVGVFIVFVCGIGVDGADFQVVCAVVPAFFEELVIFDECIDGADAKHGVKVAGVGFAVMVGDDIIGNFCQSVG